MNEKELEEFLEQANCTSSLAALKEFKEELLEETCNVCIHGEEHGCKDCKVGEFLGETPY